MKKLMCLTIAALTVVACIQEPKDYVMFSGKITNQSSDSLVIRSNTDINFQKRITVAADGTFSDTLKVVTGSFYVYDGTERTSLYLKNGRDVHLTLDTKQFDETVVYTGSGADANNYLAKKALDQEALFKDETMFAMIKEDFAAKLETIESGFMKNLDGVSGLDTAFVASEKKGFDELKKYLVSYQEDKFFLNTVLGKGKNSPKFMAYENNAGGKTSLDDLKGKYVYIDVWATWCGPCIAEIPYLKEVEKTYHSKNIQFVSLSIDEPKDYDKWKSMIKEKELGGIQLLADKAWKSEFVKNYRINGIPRFILIDPKGNIITSDAPRPSDKKLKDMFNSLSI
ncbi:TlpA disulfide reductase family protein [uncultured Flavobacterium sp.]|uniref:TlpA family protein disulfide reductase n=1 Tax=uncultured Flavobacterium sp. TaxID=165435 RepID=UPI0030CA1C79